ncbi:bifunctional glutamate/proline--tRNA ligase [Chelonus insularis]|uniref:bifunctional glutamate/proline--tRNA ligase n=1 Tax=Chelonus insularis TaxID=460826 RepID=UPI00158C0D4B|nr:bifunctional glutamate/proline--tRNA ligase [Chelonus insularis]
MSLKLTANTQDPPIGSLIVTELLSEHKKININIEYPKPWKLACNVQLLMNDQVICDDDCNVGRYLARTSDNNLYGGNEITDRTQVDSWLSLSNESLRNFEFNANSLKYLNDALTTKTWLVAKKLTLADIYTFSALFKMNYANDTEYIHLNRWYKQMKSHPIVEKVINIVNIFSTSKKTEKKNNQTQKPKEKSNASTGRKQEGKFEELEGAEMGKVVVRFPPEASGYLHIGHAKAALLNQYYADKFKGQLIMRFDDTNPAKESVEFEQEILEDLKLLEIKPDRFTHTSDYFDLMLDYCEKLIKEGKAFVDDTPALTMKEQREQKLPSTNRDNSVEKNLELWEEMKKGSAKGQECCVRAKIDYQSVNGCMRDPTIYRCKPEPHPKTDRKYNVYPTYDFACPIVDAIENVTHTLRTTEYHDRDPQFYWFIEALGLRRPYIWEYSRLNMTHTVLSKRKLTWFVENGLVSGWDDPRLPTVRGILRHGLTVEGLKQFIISQGSSKAVVFMEWDKIWAFNKKIIDPIAIRYTALNEDDLVVVNVKGAKRDFIDAQNHPKDPTKGTKKVLINKKIFIERVDAETLKVKENATFINWGNLMITNIKRDNGKIVDIDADLNLDNKDFKNTVKLTWLAVDDEDKENEDSSFIPCVAVYFDHIITKPLLAKDDDFKDFVAKDTRKEVKLLGEAELKRVKKGEIIQLQRKGFFRCDVPYAPMSDLTSRVRPLILFFVPDGHVTTSTSSTTATTKEVDNKSQKVTTSKENSEKVASLTDSNLLSEKIKDQGNKVRQLKSDKADKKLIDAEVKTLLSLKSEFKSLTGVDWKPDIEIKPTAMTNETAEILNQKITDQGNKVRQLKSEKADKAKIDTEVKVLLSLKNDYKTLTGQEWKPAAAEADKGKKSKAAEPAKKQKVKEEKKEKPKETADNLKTGTRLGLEAKKSENLSDWYSQVITKGEMIEYYDVSGCYILRPWSYSIWDVIKDFFDSEIKKLGVQNCYFPIFVSKSALEREKTHIADFAPEVAWVTKSGESDLAEPIAIRPTSETVMYPAYAKWLKSHRDLPLKLNQWNNVVRWEFKHPQPFLRTREFLWQEGHSAFLNKAEADEEVLTILELYARIYEELLAIPVVRGRKTEKEKFAGGDYTTTVEAFISASGRGIQGATSHHLGQNFSKMFDIKVEGVVEGSEKTFVYQNSWGITTRTIGVMVMVHGDDKGLVIPPKVASVQAIIIPCGITASTTTEERDKLMSECLKLENELKKDGIIRVKGDYRDNYSPGWKFNHWELKGVPLRIELGFKDLEKSQITLVRRDNGQRLTANRNHAHNFIIDLLDKVQKNMFDNAKLDLDSHTKICKNWSNFCGTLDDKNLILAPFCGDMECEDIIKKDSAKEDPGEEPGAAAMGAKSLCVPFSQPKDEKLDNLKCIRPACGKKVQFWTLFGRSY